MTDRQLSFIDEMALLLTPWGLQVTPARVYVYLQLRACAVSLDNIATDLSVSKGNASMATRLLERYGIALASRETGSKRVLYSAGSDLGAALRKNIDLLNKKSALIARDIDTVTSPEGRDKLMRLGKFYSRLNEAMEVVVSDFDGSEPGKR